MDTEVSFPIGRTGRESDHSVPFIIGIKNEWRYTSAPSYDFMVCPAEDFILPWFCNQECRLVKQYDWLLAGTQLTSVL